MNTIYTDFSRKELSYVESVLNISFEYRPHSANLTQRIVSDTTGDGDGYAMWDWRDGEYVSGQIFLERGAATQSYLFLHELGHVLGLFEHRDGHPSQTLMFAEGGGYTREYLDTVTTFGKMDIIDLWGKWGVSDAWEGLASGDARNNLIYGGSGISDVNDNNDLIAGAGGEDALFGNAGDDTIYGGSGEADRLDSSDFIHGGAGDDFLFGNAGDDTLKAGAGNDWLYGGAGNDALHGGAGVNHLFGGIGGDIFYVDQDDVILDFDSSLDILFLI